MRRPSSDDAEIGRSPCARVHDPHVRGVAVEVLPSVLIPAPKGPSGRIGPGTSLMTSYPFGRPSKSPSQTSDSTRKSGVVSRPCHSLASLKYSFWAPVRYGPMAGRTLVGGFRHVIQSKGGTPLSVPTRWTVENGGRETMNLGTNAMSWGGVRPGGSDANCPGYPLPAVPIDGFDRLLS